MASISTEDANLRATWGKWIDEILWDHFCTLTFHYGATIDGAKRQFLKFIRRLDSRAQMAVEWFMVIERGPGGAVHVHALLRATDQLENRTITEQWPNGRTDIRKYDPARGGAYYVTKQIASMAVEYDISKGLTRFD